MSACECRWLQSADTGQQLQKVDHLWTGGLMSSLECETFIVTSVMQRRKRWKWQPDGINKQIMELMRRARMHDHLRLILTCQFYNFYCCCQTKSALWSIIHFSNDLKQEIDQCHSSTCLLSSAHSKLPLSRLASSAAVAGWFCSRPIDGVHCCVDYSIRRKRGWGHSKQWLADEDWFLSGFFFSLLNQKEGPSSLHLSSLSFTSWILLNTSVANCLCATVTWLVFISFHFPFLRLLSLHWLVW